MSRWHGCLDWTGTNLQLNLGRGRLRNAERPSWLAERRPNGQSVTTLRFLRTHAKWDSMELGTVACRSRSSVLAHVGHFSWADVHVFFPPFSSLFLLRAPARNRRSETRTSFGPSSDIEIFQNSTKNLPGYWPFDALQGHYCITNYIQCWKLGQFRKCLTILIRPFVSFCSQWLAKRL